MRMTFSAHTLPAQGTGYTVLPSREMGRYRLSTQTQGREIPFSARIFSVVDVYDALTSDRPYRLAWPEEQALAYIKERLRHGVCPVRGRGIYKAGG